MHLFKFLIFELRGVKYNRTFNNEYLKRIEIKTKIKLHLILLLSLIKYIRPYKKTNIIFLDLTKSFINYKPISSFENAIFLENRFSIKNIFSNISLPYILYFLLHTKNIWIFNKKIRKFFIKVFIKKILYLCSKKPTIIVRSDLKEANSIFASFSKSTNDFNFICVQHGFYKPWSINRYVFAGIRSENHIIFDKLFLEMYQKKLSSFNYILSPPPPFISQNSKENTNKKNIVFISSEDLKDLDCIYFLKKLKNTIANSNINLFVCPHIKDRYYLKILKKLKIDYYFSKSKKFKSLNIDNSIFVGWHSTLMYELAIYNYKMIWLKSKDIDNREMPSFKNSYFLKKSEISLEIINNIFKKKVEISKVNNIFSNPKLLLDYKKYSIKSSI